MPLNILFFCFVFLTKYQPLSLSIKIGLFFVSLSIFEIYNPKNKINKQSNAKSKNTVPKSAKNTLFLIMLSTKKTIPVIPVKAEKNPETNNKNEEYPRIPSIAYLNSFQKFHFVFPAALSILS